MSKLKLMTIVDTRSEIVRVSAIIKKTHQYFDHILIHTGQNYDYELNKIFFDDPGLREPGHYLGVVGENLGQTMGNVIFKSYELMNVVKPDAIIVLGDANSCLCVISTKRLETSVFHMEARNRCKDENLSKEVIRRIVDMTSDINLCYSEHVRWYILGNGAKPKYTFVVGSSMAEVLTDHREKIDSDDVLKHLGLGAGRYILLSAHGEKNINIKGNFFSLMNAVNAMAEKYDMPILCSCYPRSKKYIEQRGSVFDKRVTQHQPLEFSDYNKLQQDAFCVVSDGGTVSEESAYFKSPAVSVRTLTERPETVDQGVFTIGSINTGQVLQAVELVTTMYANDDLAAEVPCYQDKTVSTKATKIIQSYSGIVNKVT